MKIGFLGLGKMGQRIVAKLLADNHEVVVWNRSYDVTKEFEQQLNTVIPAKAGIQPFRHPEPDSRSESRSLIPTSPKATIGLGRSGMTEGRSMTKKGKDSGQARMTIAKDIADFIKLLPGQKIFWVMLPAGDPTESVLTQLDALVTKGDIVIDGGNSYYKNTEKWYHHFSEKGVGFLGIGVSGGVLAAKNGFPLMVGGDKSSFATIKPLLETLSKPHGGYDYFGLGGAGHFVKMVHNGVEYGMMQSIGEGFEVLQKSSYSFDLAKIAKNWMHNTIISGFLMDRTKDALQKDPGLKNIVGEIDATGEAEWTIEAAKEEGIHVKIIEESLAFRKKSKTDMSVQNSFAAKTVAALRHEFGGHKVKEKSLDKVFPQTV